MTPQIPLLLSDDAKAIIHRVETVNADRRLLVSDLMACWRPPRPPGRPWPNARIWKAIEEAHAAGCVRLREVLYGQELELSE